ncbi:hypothetical protein PIIN_00543 [Serendipita indica DSM 11827]|uniref:Smr domain-containing protein n=1 Tax=Serendipita indica (strain DSM 11827) TaxID=1109443 RepID=G4U2R0_SERID|nr:hypothetical protein PIIN_00543 [Serendipita indica DSM 11827]
MRTAQDKEALIKQLEAEFCPPLDTSLVLALCNDIDEGEESITQLRESLQALAADATVSLSEVDGQDPGSTSALPSASPSDDLNSPLQFLQNAFPTFSVHTLQEVIEDAVSQYGGLDMAKLVEELLTRETLETIGLPESPQEQPWPKTKKKQKKNKGVSKLVFGDVRHRQTSSKECPEVIDPWSQLSSLADYLSTLLTGTTASSFSSRFHSDKYPTVLEAVLAYLNDLPPSDKSTEEVDEGLIAIIDALPRDDSDEVNAQWARRCVEATDRLEHAVCLYELLQDLSKNAPIKHLQAPAIHPPAISSPLPSSSSGSSAAPTRQISNFTQPTAPSKPRKPMAASSAWRVVEKREPKQVQPHPHAEFIPAYRNLKLVPVSSLPKDPSDENMVLKNRTIEQAWRDKRVEALRKASQHWQRSQDGLGRQVAAYYADEANKFLRESREAALEAARALVVSNRAQNAANGFHTDDTVDLHGMNREEALAIVKESLNARFNNSSRNQEPLRFITGKGLHSKGHQILLPSIQKSLRSEGWRTREVEAGLIVYGRF